MGVLDKIKEGFQGHFDKRREDREMIEKVQKEADIQRRMMFEEQFRKDAIEVSMARAKRDSANLSGLQKLRAVNRARRLTTVDDSSGSFYDKLSAYMRKNKMRQEQNLERTAEMQGTAKQMQQERKLNPQGRKPFQPTGFSNTKKW